MCYHDIFLSIFKYFYYWYSLANLVWLHAKCYILCYLILLIQCYPLIEFNYESVMFHCANYQIFYVVITFFISYLRFVQMNWPIDSFLFHFLASFLLCSKLSKLFPYAVTAILNLDYVKFHRVHEYHATK